jgi:integrase
MSQDVTTDITIYSGDLSPLARAARVADELAQANKLEDYRTGKAETTLARQRDDVALFEAYLAEAGVTMAGMADDLRLWADISAGLILAFVRWQLFTKGHSVGSTNVRLSTVKTYARLSASAGYLPMSTYQEISLIKTISGREGRNINEQREKAGTKTRTGHKKADPVAISPAHVALIKQKLRELAQAGDTLAARDWFLFCLLSDHGLRCSEIAALAGTGVQLTTGLLKFYRRKGHKKQTHQLTPASLAAAQFYLQVFPVSQYTHLFLGEEPGAGLATRTINWRVGEIGHLVGIEGLSPHDLRHYWATYSKGDVGALQQAGGWTNPTMALKYRVENAIANEGLTVPGQE